MSNRTFSLQTIIRKVPNELLGTFFERMGHGEFDPGWETLKKSDIDPIMEFLKSLPIKEQDKIESEFRNVFELACDTGLNAIVESATCYGEEDFASTIPDEFNPYGRAMWSWLNHPDAFSKAQAIHQVDTLSWWRKRNDLPSMKPDFGDAARSSLENRISKILEPQGRGRVCTVETWSRGNIDYVFAHPDDFVESTTIHNDVGQLTPAAFRQTLLVVFAFDRHEGSLELFAKLTKPVKEKLEVAFAKECLGWDLPPNEPEKAYELNHLKDMFCDLETDPEDNMRVTVTKMRLSSKNSSRRVHVEIDRDDPADNIDLALRDILNLEENPLQDWNATTVTFCFEFLAREGRKAGKQTVDVSFPRSCSLRDSRPDRVELIQKYLKRWKIDCVAEPKQAALAVVA